MYRKEKSGKVIHLILWRALAAAVFIGFGLWIAVSYFNKTEKNIPVASQINNIKQPAANKKNIILKEPVKEENEIASSTKTAETEKVKKEKAEVTKPVKKEKNVYDIAAVEQELKIKKPIVKEKIKNVKPGVQNQAIAVTEPIKITPENLKNQKNQIAENETAQTINKIEPAINNTAAQTVSYVPDVSSDNQNYVFYDVPAEEFRKSKVGGFLKKVKRIVERNNPITRMFAGDEEQVAAK